jgi:hypothetical protein
MARIWVTMEKAMPPATIYRKLSGNRALPCVIKSRIATQINKPMDMAESVINISLGPSAAPG